MRQEHVKHDCLWWKSGIIFKWASYSWIFEIENAFQNTIFNSEKGEHYTYLLKWKDRLSALHPDMSGSMINMEILRKWGGEVEHAIKCTCAEPCSTENYINSMEFIIMRTRIGKTWTRNPMESKMIPNTCKDDKRSYMPFLKCHE
ncbi:hypothetical protein O181_012447 [Austropuccinia psidii MF-1]|uniref:Uncharacterized protein n=1 Tax=Austropuccinia psidii MF-1 TaxID=1389203 RepID=A0A9Q3BWH1_9BASI|nr:hypothetical protein [Austropuccinia psidii MF-1]